MLVSIKFKEGLCITLFLEIYILFHPKDPPPNSIQKLFDVSEIKIYILEAHMSQGSSMA